VVPRFGYSAREIATAMADGGAVPHSAVVSMARAMRKLEADGLVVICVPGYRRQGAQMFARLPLAPSMLPAGSWERQAVRPERGDQALGACLGGSG
jgi:hypothetical protein